MIAEYSVTLENKTKSELILFIKELQDMLKEKDREIEHQIEKRNNQKAELAILNKKQKEMNKLINTVKSYKGQIKKLEHTNRSYEGIISKQNKQIDLMADELVEAHKWFYSEFDNFNKEDFIKYFANKVNSNLEN